MGTAQTPGASLAAIQHHYDVSNEFYSLWLDSTYTYSAGVWATDDDLESAQVRKLDYHAEQARVAHAKRVLDVGCGWGSMLVRMTEHHDVAEAVGLTLSSKQAEYIRSLGKPGITVHLANWWDHAPQESYDAIVSIGAFEHFATRHLSADEKISGYRAFFRRCHQWLRPNGHLSLQTIVYENSLPEDYADHFATILPESDLPRQCEILMAADCLFELVNWRNDRHDYARTFAAWQRRLKANREAAIRCVGPEVVDGYEMFFRLAIWGFSTGAMNLARMSFRRVDDPRRP